MQEKAPYLKDQEIEIYGRYKAASFRQTMKTSEIDGWYQVTVSWEQLMGMSRPARVQMAMEGMASKIWSQEYAMDIAGVEDPAAMVLEVEQWEDRQHKQQLKMAQAEQGQQPGQGQAPGGMQPKPSVPGVSFPGQGQPGQGAPGGQGQGPPAPGMIFRPQVVQQSKPPIGGVPQGVTLTAIENALRAVADKLRGTVWAVGDLARSGQAVKPELRLSDHRDYRYVKQALATIAPDAVIKFEGSEEAMGPFKARVA
jgi:hypothetical protein